MPTASSHHSRSTSCQGGLAPPDDDYFSRFPRDRQTGASSRTSINRPRASSVDSRFPSGFSGQGALSSDYVSLSQADLSRVTLGRRLSLIEQARPWQLPDTPFAGLHPEYLKHMNLQRPPAASTVAVSGVTPPYPVDSMEQAPLPPIVVSSYSHDEDIISRAEVTSRNASEERSTAVPARQGATESPGVIGRLYEADDPVLVFVKNAIEQHFDSKKPWLNLNDQDVPEGDPLLYQLEVDLKASNQWNPVTGCIRVPRAAFYGPISQARRAVESGYDTPVFHGSSSNRSLQDLEILLVHRLTTLQKTEGVIAALLSQARELGHTPESAVNLVNTTLQPYVRQALVEFALVHLQAYHNVITRPTRDISYRR